MNVDKVIALSFDKDIALNVDKDVTLNVVSRIAWQLLFSRAFNSPLRAPLFSQFCALQQKVTQAHFLKSYTLFINLNAAAL